MHGDGAWCMMHVVGHMAMMVVHGDGAWRWCMVMVVGDGADARCIGVGCMLGCTG